MSFAEFDELVLEAQKFVGARLESVLIDNDILLLSLSRREGACSLVIDVRHRVPFFILSERHMPALTKQIKPIVLFLRAHAIGLKLISVRRNLEYGRLIEFSFGSDNNKLILEAHLFPQGKNIKVRHEDLEICLKKPQELSKVQAQNTTYEKRSINELYSEWLEQFANVPHRKQGHDPQLGLEQALEKKRAGIGKLVENRKVLAESLWPEFAEWLNRERTEQVLKKYSDMYDHKKTVVQNIERAFVESKKIKTKLMHLDERLSKLQAEYDSLKAGKTAVAPHSQRKVDSPLAGAKGRTREFDDNIRAYIGKSGTDNLKLLRQSKPWYVWVHAKDWPSAHAIIAFNKGQPLPNAVLRDVCLWVLKETISDKQWQSWLGIKVDFLYTERRFLQAVKGDHHGRVRYSEAKTITLVVE